MHVLADLWEGVRGRVRGLGGGVRVVKVKGHALVRDDDRSDDARYRRLGNRAADEAAREGASMHPSDDGARDRILRSHALVQYVGNHMARTIRASGPELLAPERREVGVRRGARSSPASPTVLGLPRVRTTPSPSLVCIR